MQRLLNKALPPKLGAFVTLSDIMHQSITARGAHLVNLSGYPVASHVVARIISQLDLTDMEKLLNSIKHVRDMSRLAADILNIIPLAKIDRQQLIRTELMSYIQQNAPAYGFGTLGTNDIDFVAYLITSSETPDTAWILDLPAADNRIIAFWELYQTLRTAQPVVVSAPGSPPTNPNAASAMMYSEDYNGSIIPATSSQRAKRLIKDTEARIANQPGEAKRLLEELGTQLTYVDTVAMMANLRIVDHVFGLLMNIDVWRTFISPRKESTSAQNAERAQSLKLFSSYLHSILIYPQIFSVELFRGSYERLEQWIASFPAVPAHILATYQDVVTKHDVLNAGQDARMLLGLLETSNDPVHNVAITGIPIEVTDIFGFADIRANVIAAASKATMPIMLKNVAALDKPEYDYVLYSNPVDTFNITHELSEAILVRDTVTQQLRFAASGVVPGITRFYSEQLLTRLKALNMAVPYGWSQNIAFSDPVTHTTASTTKGGKMKLHPRAVRTSYDYQHYLRRDQLYKIFNGNAVRLAQNSAFIPKSIENVDVADHLRGILKYEWKTLAPANTHLADKIYNVDYLTAMAGRTTPSGNPAINEPLKQLLETLTGMSFELIRISMRNPLNAQIWATYMSSWALVYSTPATTVINASTTNLSAVVSLVPGYGYPYGVTYQQLESMQGGFDAKQFIKINDTTYLRMLTKLPARTTDLRVATDTDAFYYDHPYYYFAGDTDPASAEVVTDWVIHDSMWNFGLCPILGATSKPVAFLDKRYAYTNDSIWLQTNLNYALAGESDADFTFSIPVAERSWSIDRFNKFAEYKTFGSYGKAESSVASVEQTDINKMITAMEQEIVKTDAATNPMNQDKAKTELVNKVDLTKIEHNGEKTSGKGGSHKGGGNKPAPKKEEAVIEEKSDVSLINTDEASDKEEKEEKDSKDKRRK